uniref:Zinc finger, CCHC-type n=1 Tax=Tanacetum cinerariifolium TaxID=118510 RepID=A0A6L2LBR2_TANCI|nr:zinc finger, CCHC-type [Tanacetum cinerariifolium]
MHFLLSSMSVVYMLTTPMLEDKSDNPTVDQVRRRAKWDNDDYVCKGLILNAKYMAEDASSKKFLVSNFTNYKMTDLRPVLEKYNELLGRFIQYKINMDESIQVSCIIDKLPPTWKDFKHTLKHMKEELTLVKLGSLLSIEESLRVQDSDKPKGNNVAGPLVVNMEAINDKMDSTMGNNTWVLTDLPLGIYYFDTYALVARISTIRPLIAMASIHSLIIHQMDMKTDFLNGELEEEVYMNQPLGFILPGNENKVDLTKEFLSSRFYMKDMKEADVILGMTLHLLWASKKQTCITGSTMEYEFVALAAGGKEAKWLKNLLLEIPLWVKPMAPIFIPCDSVATLAKAYSQIYNRKSRHLGVRHSMIRELIINAVISIEFVRSQQNLVDHLKKGLARDFVIKSAEEM